MDQTPVFFFMEGKTTLELAGQKTILVVFCSTYYKDDTWKRIRQYCDKKGIQIIAYD